MGSAKGNATEATAIAGYKGNRVTLEAIGRENLGKPRIKKAIDERVQSSPEIADREARQKFWTNVMNDVCAEMRDRLRASELLGKSQADFIAKVEAQVEERTVQYIKIGDREIEF